MHAFVTCLEQNLQQKVTVIKFVFVLCPCFLGYLPQVIEVGIT